MFVIVIVILYVFPGPNFGLPCGMYLVYSVNRSCLYLGVLSVGFVLAPHRLATLLAKERSHSLTYIGCIKKGPVTTNPQLKWYAKSGHLIGSEYFLHAYGPIYALSAEVVASLPIARNNRLIMLAWQ
ncbi:probable beta-1,3-galactosyltransferase 12 isoform X2 [Camellia sinensis]|uniref:probable beta-1,3-galactosyltransferase 12 isoform X2 n=1 Tax=Camellia sinensis TaxID=4442 RepID=UPI00103675DC|nr:probable beta-1,3-galactosyltransferase 12 isoform X2 [Camellia sinensis]